MLTWFVGPHKAESAILGPVLTEKDVKSTPSTVPSACLDKNLDLHRIRPYFSTRLDGSSRSTKESPRQWLVVSGMQSRLGWK